MISVDSLLFQKIPELTQKKKKYKLFSQEMHLKKLLSRRNLKLSNSKPRCNVSALHFFVKYIQPMALQHRAHSDKRFFSFYYSRINPRFTAGKQMGV